MALLAFVLLLGLGTWQLERRIWKLDLIAHVDARVHAVPVAAPAHQGGDDEYRRVTATGRFLNDKETLVQAVSELGAGYWVLTPLQTARGVTILINRGFVPMDRRAPAERRAGEIAGPVTVTGLMRLSEPKGGFLRANDSAHDRWFSRDVAAIGAARGLGGLADYFIDADATPNPGGLPVGGLTVIAFPNNHLVYAITWFGMALMLAGAAAYGVRDEWCRRRSVQ